MKINVYKAITFLLFLLTIAITFVSCQETELTPCARVGSSARSYDDCKNYDNETAFTLCCFVQGTSNNSDEASCLDVDILFKDRVIEYASEGVSGKLICKANEGNSASFIHIKYSLLLLIFSFIL